jgi:CDGSH-type Zn-finger protein
MARLVTKTAHQPKQVEKDSWVCMCGLSKSQPVCDSSHKRTADEDEELYVYEEGGRHKVKVIKATNGCCNCCSHK